MKAKHLKIGIIYFFAWYGSCCCTIAQIRVIDNKGTLQQVDPTVDALENNESNTRVELSSNSDGSSRLAGTEFVIGDNGRVGIGTSTPSTRLDVRTGNLRLGAYSNNRDDTASTSVLNILYTNAEGVVLSAPVAVVSVAATAIKTAEFAPSSSFNVNTLGSSAKNFFGTEISNDGAVSNTNASTITINEAGIYNIDFNCYFSSFGNRSAPMATLVVNGSNTRVRAATGYIRNGSGHNRSSWNFHYTRRFDVGDSIRIFTEREAGSNTTNIDTNFTTFVITKLGL
ncbi:MAG: hypothetical protein OIF50_06310 [Flavobacteriaceae bacterium]|nr:hypothetical protein [Flavobacteriaceae bacterium]